MFSLASSTCAPSNACTASSQARSNYLLIADVISAVVLVGVFTLFASGALPWHGAALTLLGAAGVELVLAAALRIPCRCAATHTSSAPQPQTRPSLSGGITREELAKHNKADDCWVAIRGNVYNVTSFLDEHPGGTAVVLDEAGKDATSAFNQIGHSNEAEAMLAQYLVGQLARQ